ncbi:MAG: DMT family transporter [Acidobacteriia bacterium]|nr:DMT family transporter [Terriglobia bacterium]
MNLGNRGDRSRWTRWQAGRPRTTADRRRRADAALAFNTVIWGSTFVLVKAALRDVSPLLFLALRFSLAALALLALFRGPGNGSRNWKAAAAGALSGAFLFSGYVLQTLGLRLTTAPRSAFLTGLTSVMVPLLAALVYKTRPQVSEVLGLLVATAGLGLMTLEGEIGAIGRGDLLTLFCAIAFAAHIVTVGHFSEKMSFELLSVTQIGAAAVLASSLFWWVERPHVEWRPAVVCAILITGLLATALAFTIQAWALQYTTSSRAALIYMLEPVFAWITSYFLVGEGLSVRAAAGAALILSGVLLVEMKPLNSRAHPSH